MFEWFPHVVHYCKMGNLFMSVGLAMEANSLPTWVLVHGVICKLKFSVPPCVVQEEKAGKVAERAWGMVKAAVIKKDGKSHGLIVASCYNQKPF